MTHPLLNEPLAADHRRDLRCAAETRRRARLRRRLRTGRPVLSTGGRLGTLDR